MQVADLDPCWLLAVDLDNAIEVVRSELLDLRAAADPKSIYDGTAIDEEDAKYLRQLMDIYSKAIEVCESYLQRKITVKCLYDEFIKLDLKHLLLATRKQLRREQCRKLYSEESSDDGFINEDSDDDGSTTF